MDAAVPPQPYPAAGNYPATFELDRAEHIANWRPLVQWILVIPHAVILYFVSIIAGGGPYQTHRSGGAIVHIQAGDCAWRRNIRILQIPGITEIGGVVAGSSIDNHHVPTES